MAVGKTQPEKAQRNICAGSAVKFLWRWEKHSLKKRSKISARIPL